MDTQRFFGANYLVNKDKQRDHTPSTVRSLWSRTWGNSIVAATGARSQSY